MRILALSSWWPFPADNGARMRIANLLAALAIHHDVHLVSLSQDPVSEAQLQSARQYCASVSEVRQRVWKPQRFDQIASLWSTEPASARATYNSEFAALVRARAGAVQPDLVIAFQIAAAPYAREVPGAPRLLEELEISNIFDQYRNARPQRRMRAWLTWVKHRAYIRHLLAEFDACSMVSEREQMLAQSIASTPLPTMVIPNGADVAPLETQPRVQPDTLIYPGALSYSANLDAMRFFIGDILPGIRAQRPAARLRITGKATDEQRAALPSLDGVELTGYVEDIRSTVAESYCEVVPLREGGGTRLKVLEALAVGTPVVSTRKGVEGLDLVDGRDVLIADAPEEFARAALQVLTSPDLRARLSEHGARSVRARYDWRVVGSLLETFVQQTASSKVRGHGYRSA